MNPNPKHHFSNYTEAVQPVDFEAKVHTVETAYNLCASQYDSWVWQKIWSALEWPTLQSILAEFECGQDQYLSQISLLDVGVGTGNTLQKIRSALPHWQLYGIDVSNEMLDIAYNKIASDVQFKLMDITEDLVSLEKFDIIIMNRTLSNICRMEIAISNISNMLKPNGKLIISDIDPSHNYRHTKLPYGNSKLRVETYKRSAAEIIRACNYNRLFHQNRLSINNFKDHLQNIGNLPESLKKNSDIGVLMYLLVFEKVDIWE